MTSLLLPFLLIVALLNSCIELEISAPSFPAIAAYFNTSENIVGMTIASNLFGFCLASLIYGPLSECYGRRRIMLIGNGILLIGAVGCVSAPSIEFLIATRFIQGLGAATSAVVVSAMIADVYPSDKAAKLYGLMNAVFSTLMALAPVAGSFINTALGWRGNYGSVALICLISWLLLLAKLPETKQGKSEFTLKQVASDYKTLLSSPLFISAAAAPSLLYGAYMAFVTIASFLYMETYGLSTQTYALHQGFIVACFALMSLVAGKALQAFGPRNCIKLGISLNLIASGGVFFFSLISPFSYYSLTGLMGLSCIGSALLYPIVFSQSLEVFPTLKGTASSAIMCLRYLLCSGLTGLASYLYDGSLLSLAFIILGAGILAAGLCGYLLRTLQLPRQQH